MFHTMCESFVPIYLVDNDKELPKHEWFHGTLDKALFHQHKKRVGVLLLRPCFRTRSSF